MTANGRHARYYIAGRVGDPERLYMAVTYHRPSGRVRRGSVVVQCHVEQLLLPPVWACRTQRLTISPKLLERFGLPD